MFDGEFGGIFESTKKLSERFGKINEYFPVEKEELLDFWIKGTTKEGIQEFWTDVSEEVINRFLSSEVENILRGQEALVRIGDYAERHGIVKDVDMPGEYPSWMEMAEPWNEAFGLDYMGRAMEPDYSEFHTLVNMLEEYAGYLGTLGGE
jgi:hypothetical protein